MSNGVSFFDGAESYSNKDYQTQPSEPSMSAGTVVTPAYGTGEMTKTYDTPKSNESVGNVNWIGTPLDQ